MVFRLAIGLLLASFWTKAEESGDSLAIAGVREFTAAYQAWEAARFEHAAKLFEQACRRAPESGTNAYWRGTAEFHRLLCLLGEAEAQAHRAEAAEAIGASIEALTRALKLNERDAESHALLGTVYGMSIAMSPPRALWLGPRVSKHQKKALRCGPANPRVQFLLGMSHYHAAGFGGGKKAALACLLKAEELYAQEAQGTGAPLEPRWGRGSCLAFIGKTYDALGQPQEAEKYFRRSLEVNPRDRLAREELAKRKP